MEMSVPVGTVTPLENVNGRNTRRVMLTGESTAHISSSHLISGEGIRRTVAKAVNPVSLAQKTVDLVHFIHGSLRPAFFCDHSLDLLSKGFDMLGVG
jgi:hypothetical protein